MSKTACPLDCYDACIIDYTDDKIKPNHDHITQGFLCPHLNHYEKEDFIQKPTYLGKEISLNAALDKLQEILTTTEKNSILHYRGHGNFALMQEVTDHFFASFGATLTDGTLCDGAGEAGIIEGRGSNQNMTMDEIAKSEVVIFWGRNPHTTSSHLLPSIKDKTIIVIDPVKTKIAKSADLHIQITPHGDLYLAMLLTRFLHINDACDKEFLEKYASEFEDYYELTQGIRIKATLDEIDVTLGQIGHIIEMVQDKKVAIVCGVGIQKYEDGADVMRAIDAFGVALGLFGKEGCGVAYLGASRAGIHSPFNTNSKKVSKVDTNFAAFETVFIQGTNPLSQMPNTSRVQESISQVKNIIYFGLHENESSKVAHLVIPAKAFLYKDDIRTSYSHNGINLMSKQKESAFGISEYDLAAFLCQAFDINLKSQEEYLTHFKSFAKEIKETEYEVARQAIAYQNGFDTDDGEFLFLEEFEKVNLSGDELHLITPKSPKSLNSQFKREEFVYLHSSLGYPENKSITISSAAGSVTLNVKYNDDLRSDCVLIYSGTVGVNFLTSSKHSLDGKSAIYQENRVTLI
jgi:anaerobic selenocysteine-containing dehydrogenase